jgi:uncharacterized protein
MTTTTIQDPRAAPPETGRHWLQLASGAPFALKGPVTPLDIADVASGLAKLNRFAGATLVPYSVAQHSVEVAKLVARHDPSAALDALLHDAHEIALSDIPRPARLAMPQAVQLSLKTLAAEIDTRIRVGLKLFHGIEIDACPRPGREALIRFADDTALATEKRDLMAETQLPWVELPPPLEAAIVPVDWREAKAMFLEAWLRWARSRGAAGHGAAGPEPPRLFDVDDELAPISGRKA